MQDVTTDRPDGRELLEKARRYFPGGAIGTFLPPEDLDFVVARGEGSKVYDEHGRAYVDYVLASGPLILGHAHPAVVAALQEAVARGTSYGAPSPLEVELARLVSQTAEPIGARGEERARTVTFSSDSLTTMVTVTPESNGQFRIDGWLAPGAALAVELRTPRGSLRTMADADGRFDFTEVRGGLVQLVIHPTEGCHVRLCSPVVTPAIEL